MAVAGSLVRYRVERLATCWTLTERRARWLVWMSGLDPADTSAPLRVHYEKARIGWRVKVERWHLVTESLRDRGQETE